MKFEITNYKKINHVEIGIDKITCLCGNGMAGKTSILNAIGCLMTSNSVPFNKFPKKMAHMFVGSNGPSATLEYKDNIKIEYPAIAIESNNKFKQISMVAANFVDFMEMDKTSRIDYVISLTNAVPTDDELKNEIKFLDEKQVTNILMEIKAIGYDSTAKKYKDSATKLKGAWENTTGLNYGSKISQNYEPDNFNIGIDVVQKNKELQTKQEELNKLTKTAIISESDTTKLKEQVGNIDKLKKDLSVVKAQIEAKKKELKGFYDKNGVFLVCPNCNEDVVYADNKLSVKDKTMEYDNEKVDGIKKYLAKLDSKLITIQGEIGAALKAQTTLNETTNNKVDVGKIDEIMNEINTIENEISAYEKKVKADDINGKINILNKIIEILKPTGIRKKVLSKKIAKFNNGIKYFTDLVEWETIKFLDDGEITINGMPYNSIFLSRSQMYRVKVLFKLMIATLDHSELVIIDDMDILMKQERSKLLKLLLCPVLKDKKYLIAIAYNSKDEAPDFSKGIKGWQTLWIDDGNVK